MKSIWKKFRFHKPDEMERHILFKAQRNAYLFLVAALVVWTFYESWQVYARHTRLNLLPCLLLTGAVLIQGISQLLLTRRAVQGDEDSYETGPLVRLVALVCAAACVLAVLMAAVALLCVRV